MAVNNTSLRQENNFEITRVLIRGRTKFADATTETISIEIYESLEGLIYGTATVVDTTGIVDLLEIVGDESIDIEFVSKKGASLHRRYRKTFRINDFTRLTDETSTKEMIEFHFENQANIENNLIKKSQTYRLRSVSEIITGLLSEFRSLETYDIQVEETLYQREFRAYFQKPFSIIKKLSENCASKVNRSCKFFFYEDQEGIKFRSLGTLKSTPFVYTITRESESAKTYNSGDTNRIRALRMYTAAGANVAVVTDTGDYGARVYSHSLINKTILIQDLTDTRSIQENPLLNPIEIEGDDVAEADKPFNSIMLMPGDGFYRTSTLTPQGHVNAVQLLEETRLNNKIIYAEIPGLTDLTVGQLVNIDHVTLGPEIKSKVASGVWLITKLSHKITQNQFVTHLELATDSVAQLVGAP